jgi:hypothetical protein
MEQVQAQTMRLLGTVPAGSMKSGLDAIVEKLAVKHRVAVDEVEQVLVNRPRWRYVERGHRRGEDVYAAIGRTDGDRRLVVFFVYKRSTRDA